MTKERGPKRLRVHKEAESAAQARWNFSPYDQILAEALQTSDKALSMERKRMQDSFEAILSSLPLIGITQEDMSKEYQEPYSLAGTNAHFRFYFDQGADKSGRRVRPQRLTIIKHGNGKNSEEIVLTCDGRARLDGSNRSSRGYFEMQLEPDGPFINKNAKLVLDKATGITNEIVASIKSREHSIDDIRSAVLKTRKVILENLSKQGIYLPSEIPETTLGVTHQGVKIPGTVGVWDITFKKDVKHKSGDTKKENYHGVGIILEHKEQRRDGIQVCTDELHLWENGDGYYAFFVEGESELNVFTHNKLKAKIKNPHLLFLRVNDLHDAIKNPPPPKTTIFEKARDLGRIRFSIKES